MRGGYPYVKGDPPSQRASPSAPPSASSSQPSGAGGSRLVRELRELAHMMSGWRVAANKIWEVAVLRNSLAMSVLLLGGVLVGQHP